MSNIIAKKNFTTKGKYYDIGDVINFKDIDAPLLIKLNERGFINPLTPEQISEIIEGSNPKIKKKEEK